MSSPLPDIRTLSLEELGSELTKMGEKPFRSRQIYEWIWKHNIGSFDEMRNISLPLRKILAENFGLGKIMISDRIKSSDGTIKFVFLLADGNEVEGVLIPTTERVTACVSSQAGCSLSCKFCATGYLDLKKNLLGYEIYDQVDIIRKVASEELGRPLTNIVYMGMGEPLLNYRNVMHSVAMICSEDGMAMSPRRITVSTAGIAKMIRKLGDDNARFEFALSLHAADDEKRNQIMPINEHNSLEALGDALKYFHEKTGTRVTYEYIIFKDFNDSMADADQLIDFCRLAPSKVNIIEYNPISEAGFQNTSGNRMHLFRDRLEEKGVIVNIRRSRGRDIDGACGQLALRKQKG